MPRYRVGDRLVIEGIFTYEVAAVKKGGMAYVYLLDRVTPKNVPDQGKWSNQLAAKTFAQPELFEQQFLRELNIWIELELPNSVPLLSATRIDGQLFALMPRYECSLADTLQSECKLAIPIVATHAIGVAECLNEAHKRYQLLHLDLKPNNLLISQSYPTAQLSDWGIANILSKRSRIPLLNLLLNRPNLSTMANCGTLPYMSPERLRGRQPQVGDGIFSLGLILCELATGFLPTIDESPLEIANAICSSEYFSRAQFLLSETPVSFATIVLKCLAPKRRYRYLNYSQLISDLKRVY